MRSEGTVLKYPGGEMALGARRVAYVLRESGRARWLSLWGSPATGLVVTAPSGTAAVRVGTFLVRHRRWIARWAQRLERRERRGGGVPRRWPYGTHLLYRGEAHAVLVRQARAGVVERTAARELVVSSPAASIEGARRLLARWLMRQAEPLLRDRVAALGARMGLSPRRVYVRPLRGGWGYCWPGGSVSVNSRLVMAAPEALDYVVVHELSHLREPNHSARFWAMVADACPGFRQARAWLGRYGPCLEV